MNKRKLKITIGNKLLFTLFTVIVVLLSVLYSLFLNNYFNKPANSIDFTSSEVQYVSANSSAVTSENLISDLFVMDVSAVSNCSQPVCYFIDETFHYPPTTCTGLTETDCGNYEICEWKEVELPGQGTCADSCSAYSDMDSCKDVPGCKWSSFSGCKDATYNCSLYNNKQNECNKGNCFWIPKTASKCNCKGDCKSKHNCIQGAMIGNECVESCSISFPIPAECDGSAC